MQTEKFHLRLATTGDVPALTHLIERSVRELQASDYSSEQREGALGTVFGVDTQLIDDRTYFVIEAVNTIVACGGWSRRKTPFGSDHGPARDSDLLNPETDAAKIRAFFVHPDWARKGLGTMILQACEQAAANAGFAKLEMTATLTGIRFYETHGYRRGEEFEIELANGSTLLVVKMQKDFAEPRPEKENPIPS